MGNSGGGGGSHHVHHVHHVVNAPDPAVEKAKIEAEKKAARLAAEAEEKKSIKAFGEQVSLQFDAVIEHASKMSVTNAIEKKEGERHISFIGPVSSGKTTLQNVMFDLDNPVALGDCTEGCKIVCKGDNLVVWDMCGDNMSFQYYKSENLNFIKSLDKCVVLFDSDVASVSWILKMVYVVNPSALLIARTKVDQHDDSNIKSIDEEKIEDGEKVQRLLGLDEPFPTYCISAHNVSKGKELYDYDKLRCCVPTS